MTDPESNRLAWALLPGDNPAPSREYWPDPEVGPYLIEIEWTLRRGRAEVVSFTVRSARREGEAPGQVELPSRGEVEHFVHGMTFRDMAPGKRIEAARARAGREPYPDHPADVPPDSLVAFLRREAVPFAETTRRGPRVDPDEYAEVAAVYMTAQRQGRPTGRAVATHFQITESAARKRIKRARQAGLLPPAGDKSKPKTGPS